MRFLASMCLLGAAAVSATRIFLENDGQKHLGDVDGEAVKSPIDSKSLQDTISGDNLLARAKELYELARLSEDEYNHPTRVIGSKGHNATLSYIHSALTALAPYYFTAEQTFNAVTSHIYESSLVLDDQHPRSASPMSLSPPTADFPNPVFGTVVLVGGHGCSATDFPAAARGNIALIERGECSFGHKSSLAGRAGARAAVVYNNEEGPLHGTLGSDPLPAHVPTWGLSLGDARPLLGKLRAGEEVDGIAFMDSVISVIPTRNIIAQTVEGDADNCVMLGGHSDSVGEGPGINDDGSGSLTLLEVATQLTRFEVNNCVRFAWWSGEEEGLLGSDYYVSVLPAEENVKIRLFMDYDMLASPNYAYQVYDARNKVNPTGSQELRDMYVAWYEDMGLNYTYIPFDGRSDYDGFIRNGIPGGGIATGAEGVKTGEEEEMFGGKAGDWYDPCYHQLCDDVSNLNMTAWEINAKLVAHSVAVYAKSFEGFPKRKEIVEMDYEYEKRTKYHGSKLVL